MHFRPPVTDSIGGLIATITLGNSPDPLHLYLSKTDPRSMYFTRLYVDRNRDRDFNNDGPPYSGTGVYLPQRNRHYAEFEKVALPYEWRGDVSSSEEPFLCTLYFYYPDDGGNPKIGNILRQCWREGRFAFGDRQIHVFVVDDDANGVYDANDRWALLPVDSLGSEVICAAKAFRSTTRVQWLDEITAFELIEISPRGTMLRLKKKDADLSREEDLANDSPYAHEPARPRAARTITWERDYATAIRKARREKRNLLVRLCTTWSNPCVIFEERTFRDAEVVSLTDAFVCLDLDGDSQRHFIRRFQVQQYPTILILNAKGIELSRVVGYQPASEFSRFLRRFIPAAKN